MVKFDEQKQIDSVNGALALRPQIEELIDRLLAEGVKNLCWLGIGGTWASCMQVVCYLKEHTDMDTFPPTPQSIAPQAISVWAREPLWFSPL